MLKVEIVVGSTRRLAVHALEGLLRLTLSDGIASLSGELRDEIASCRCIDRLRKLAGLGLFLSCGGRFLYYVCFAVEERMIFVWSLLGPAVWGTLPTKCVAAVRGTRC